LQLGKGIRGKISSQLNKMASSKKGSSRWVAFFFREYAIPEAVKKGGGQGKTAGWDENRMSAGGCELRIKLIKARALFSRSGAEKLARGEKSLVSRRGRSVFLVMWEKCGSTAAEGLTSIEAGRPGQAFWPWGWRRRAEG